MKEKIIEELKEHFERLKNQENNEIGELVREEIWKITSGEIDRRIKEKEQLGENDARKIADDIISDLKIDHLEKFIGLTQEAQDEIAKRCAEKVIKKNTERTHIIGLLTWLIDYLNLEEPLILLELDKLSQLFQFINLHVNSQIAIFSYIVRINHKLDHGSDEKVILPDAEAMLNYEYKHIKVSELRKIFEERRFKAFMESRSLRYQKARKEVIERYEETKRDFTPRQQACNILGEIFEKDAIDVTEEDYQTIIEKMNELFFGHIAYRVVKQLKKQKEIELNPPTKEEKVKKNPKDNKNPQDKNKKQSEAPKKQTSLNQTIREINKYFDLDTLELKEVLSLDQIIYVLSLMFSINIEHNIVESFLRSSMREFKEFHPYAIYNQAYDKFAYLGNENSEIQENLDLIEYILSEVNIFMCDDEKYESTKELIEEEINELMRIINGNYTYEIDEAKKLLKTSEE